uniref:BTB domain-containing protein n=1 Tax=Strigamia maritima TaxID=126957 RepID=T1J3G2_STRMM
MPMLNINDIMGLKSNIESNRKSIKSPVMWRKASCPDPELDGDFFTFVASKRKTLSEIPGRDATQIPMKNEVQEAEKCLSKEFRHPGFFPKQFSYAQINNIDDLITDFGSMVGNPELSDVTIRTRDECVIPAHRFIFFARCVELYEETEKTPILDWPMVSAEAANLFLFFLYNAQLVSKNENVLKEVQILAERYNVHKLLDRLPKSFEMSAENRLILSPECMSPELLPMSEYENNLSDNDDDCCESPIIYSQFSQKCDGKTEFKSPLPIKLGTSTPKSNVDNTRKPRTSSISTITSDGDNEIESSLTRAVFSNTINEIQRENSDVEPRPLVSSPVIGCFSQKYDSIHCLEEDSFTRFNNSRMNDSQPESLHNLESVPDENIFCKSPIINSKFSMEGDNREDFQSPIKNETSTPISKLVNIRLPRISRLSTINTSDGNNEIESAFTSPIISGSNSKMDDSVIDLEDAPGVIASSPVIASVSQKFIVDANESSVRFQWLREDYSENNITVFDGVPKHNSSRTCYSQSEALHKREREPEGNDTWKDFDDINHNFSLSRSPPKPPDESLSPPYNPLLSDTPILPLAERIKKFRNPEKPISDTQNESSDCRQVTTSKARPVTPKKAISNTHTKPVDCHQATPKKTISETNTRTKKVIRRRKQISSSQPVTSNITPKPNFIDMNTPDIKNQLKKYGIRQLPNKKAIKMLEHIYEGTHPMVTDSEHENSAIDISIKMADNANEDNLSGSQSDHLNE